jgi:hypothetical protein
VQILKKVSAGNKKVEESGKLILQFKKKLNTNCFFKLDGKPTWKFPYGPQV